MMYEPEFAETGERWLICKHVYGRWKIFGSAPSEAEAEESYRRAVAEFGGIWCVMKEFRQVICSS